MATELCAVLPGGGLGVKEWGRNGVSPIDIARVALSHFDADISK